MSSAEDNLEADDEGGEASDNNCCASCDRAELDDVKLKPCDGCDLVRYCSDECKEDHRSEHKAKCKERAAELRDEILFKQPEGTHLGDCPICSLPLQIEHKKTTSFSCCSKVICKGCSYALFLQQEGSNVQPVCPFCRHPEYTSSEEDQKNLMKRVAANDPGALCVLGYRHLTEGEYDRALKYWTKAAEMGDAMTHFNLFIIYSQGQGVEKDETKKIFHLEEAAILGHPHARYNLGCHEWRSGRIDRAVKHYIISATLGHDESIQAVKGLYKDGYVSKEDFAAALRAHHVAVNAMKSPTRREAAEFLEVLVSHR